MPGYTIGGEFTEIFEVWPAKVTPVISTDVYGRRAIDMVMESLGDYDPETLVLKGKLADAAFVNEVLAGVASPPALVLN